MFWNWNEYTSNQEMLYDETAYTMLNLAFSFDVLISV